MLFLLLMSNVRYCFTVWCKTGYIHRLTLLQKRAISSIFGIKSNTSCIPYFQRYRLLTIATLLILNYVKFFCGRGYVGERDPGFHFLRASTICFQPRPEYLNRRTYMGAKIMNHLPRDLLLVPFPAIFRILRNFLRGNLFYTLNEFFARAISYNAKEIRLFFT